MKEQGMSIGKRMGLIVLGVFTGAIGFYMYAHLITNIVFMIARLWS